MKNISADLIRINGVAAPIIDARCVEDIVMFKSIFFPMQCYPEPTITEALSRVVDLASVLSVSVTARAYEGQVPVPIGAYGDVVSLGEFLAAEYVVASSNARKLVVAFEDLADVRSIRYTAAVDSCMSDWVTGKALEQARCHDMTVIPLSRDGAGQRDLAESLIFDSGRPVLLFPEIDADGLPKRFNHVLIAWDGKGPASRAVFDAMPFLAESQSVEVATVASKKQEAEAHQSADRLVKYLWSHGIAARVSILSGEGRTAGEVIEQHCLNHPVDLTVMGAYGHSRFRETFLGGVSDDMLTRPPGFVFMSH
ncbi:MAG: universal stress protein [Sphingobacteriales bacterium]|nr:MAG: universal stress protein [Sphingobacteriales bacterium]